MKEKLEALLKDGVEKIKAVKNEAELQEIKKCFAWQSRPGYTAYERNAEAFP